MEDKCFMYEFRYSTGEYEYINVSGEMTLQEAIETRMELDSVFKTKKETEVLCCGICKTKEPWDNRAKKLSKQYSDKAPDFKCRNKECGSLYWESSKDWVEPRDNG